MGTSESIVFLYFIALYTNWGFGVKKGMLGGRRVHPSSQLFIIMFLWVILVTKHIYLMCDLKMIYLMI